MHIKEINRFSNRVFDAVISLVPQLAPGAHLPTEQHFRKILKSKNSHFFMAETDEKEIAGMLTLGIYDIPTGTKIWIEDVVVDEAHKGKGYGKALMLFAMEYAKKTGAKSIELTSRPSRIEANQLYQKLGFILRETNVYRYPLE